MNDALRQMELTWSHKRNRKNNVVINDFNKSLSKLANNPVHMRVLFNFNYSNVTVKYWKYA